MEKGAFQMLRTIKGVFILFFLSFLFFFNEDRGTCNRAKREFGSPPPAGRVLCVRQWGAGYGMRGGSGSCTGSRGGEGGCASLPRWLLAPSNATGKLQRKAPPLAFSSSPCRQAFQMGLNEKEK